MKHQTPSDEIFNEIKNEAIEIWKGYDNTYGYATEKIERVNQINNIEDNVMIFYRMFDRMNQSILESKLSEEALGYISENK